VRELPTGLVLGGILGVIGFVRIVLWQNIHIFNYGPHYMLLAITVGFALVGIVAFGSLAGSMLPFLLKRIGFDPASASAPFVATLVDVTGLVIYFSVAFLILHGTPLAEAGSGKREGRGGGRGGGTAWRREAEVRMPASRTALLP
jgi:magnesium transporter